MHSPATRCIRTTIQWVTELQIYVENTNRNNSFAWTTQLEGEDKICF